jgi:Serine carboxypeptidase S28
MFNPYEREADSGIILPPHLPVDLVPSTAPDTRSLFEIVRDYLSKAFGGLFEKVDSLFRPKAIHRASVISSVLWDISSEMSQGMTEREILLQSALAESTGIYFNYTGTYPCTNLSDWEGTGNLDGFGWNILACNQLAMPVGFNEESMFLPQPFDYDSYTRMCQDAFGLTPDYNWALDYFGGYNINKDFLATTNIVFSNGELDPWRAGGLNSNVTADGSGIALYIEGGAHHLDLRTPTDLDPPTLIQARAIEMANIKKWIAEYQN